MILVEIYYYNSHTSVPCILCETEEEADEYIEKELEKQIFTGNIKYLTSEIDIYKGDKYE